MILQHCIFHNYVYCSNSYVFSIEKIQISANSLAFDESLEKPREEERDLSEMLLERCGLWGCLLAGILSAKISQYVLACDVSQRIEFATLAAYFFKARLLLDFY